MESQETVVSDDAVIARSERGPRRFVLGLYAHSKTWLRWLAVVAGALAVVVVATAWLSIAGLEEHEGASWIVVWAVVAVVSCVYAVVGLLVVATGRAPMGVSIALVVVSFLGMILNVIAMVVAAVQWPDWLSFMVLLVTVFAFLVFTMGMFWPAMERLRARVDKSAAPA